MPHLITTHGPLPSDRLGMILPHEHIFVDLRPTNTPDFGQAQAEDVIRLMAPELERARAAGVTALVECTPEGVGRRSDLVTAVARAANFPLVLATGIYREPWVPDWAQRASEDELAEWMQAELTRGIGQTGVLAGFIKLSAGDDGLTPTEIKILRAAAHASRATRAVIASHTICGRVVADQLDILESMGASPQRFIWVHTQAEPDLALHLEMARRGAWLEYDGIGGGVSDEQFIEYIRRALDAGFTGQVMLSMDRGWYSPGQPGGGKPKPFTYLSETFLPRLRAAGLSEEVLRQLTVHNPFHAFAR
jgi:phosphotriesterase-related protein